MGGTYGGNPVTCVAAIAAIEMIRQPSFLARAERIGTISLATRWTRGSAASADWRCSGAGSMMVIELVKDRASRATGGG